MASLPSNERLATGFSVQRLATWGSISCGLLSSWRELLPCFEYDRFWFEFRWWSELHPLVPMRLPWFGQDDLKSA